MLGVGKGECRGDEIDDTPSIPTLTWKWTSATGYHELTEKLW